MKEGEILKPPTPQSNWDYQLYHHRNSINSFLEVLCEKLGKHLVIDEMKQKSIKFNQPIRVKTLVNTGMVVLFDIEYL